MYIKNSFESVNYIMQLINYINQNKIQTLHTGQWSPIAHS